MKPGRILKPFFLYPLAGLLAVSCAGNRQSENARTAKVDVASHLLGTGTSDFSLVGKSIVIHAQEGDYQFQPSGGSGQKIACGVITRAEG